MIDSYQQDLEALYHITEFYIKYFLTLDSLFLVSHEDEKTEGWCEIICVIPELKTNKRLSGGKFVDKPTGGKLNCKFTDR